MAKPEIIKEHPISLVEMKKEIEDIRKRDKELGFRSTKTEDYLNHFVTLTLKKAEELKSSLEALKINRLKEEFIVKIIDTMPATVDELKTLLQGYVVTINQEDMKKVVDVVNQFIPGKK